MVSKHFLLTCLALLCICLSIVLSQSASDGGSGMPRTRFACRGRPPGYYADVETGCQVYHMCDALGRQFSYTCPNTTLFQQRMLVCDHWYMVNCSKSESDYGANLLIGQRDKPFVSDEEMRQRTPRPDILSVPPNNNYYDGLKEAESKYPVHPGNSIVGVADSISSDNNGLDSGKNQYRPPTAWSTGTEGKRPQAENQNTQNLGGSNQRPGFGGQGSVGNRRPSENPNGKNPQNQKTNNRDQGFESQNGQSSGFSNNGQGFSNYRPSAGNQNQNPHTSQTKYTNQNTKNSFANQNQGIGLQNPNPTQTTPDLVHNSNVPQPSLDLTPPLAPPKPTTTQAPSSEEYDLDIRMKNNREDPVIDFINRFDPNLPESHKTSMTPSEILDINQQLPQGHDVSSEDTRTSRKNKNRGNNFNTLESGQKRVTTQSRFNTVNLKPTIPTTPTPASSAEPENQGIPQPDVNLLPPKTDYTEPLSTTMGPPVYYEWKWAVPAFDLEPPKHSNVTYNNTAPTGRSDQGKRPFSDVTRPTTTEEVTPSSFNTEYNISSYFVPDYIFPLDKPHPGYEDDEAQTSFQVNVARPGRSSFGENKACPHCHPGYVKPGTCEPCIIER